MTEALTAPAILATLAFVVPVLIAHFIALKQDRHKD